MSTISAICHFKNLLFTLQMNQTTLEMIKTDVIQKAVDGMQQEGRKYVGKIMINCSKPTLK